MGHGDYLEIANMQVLKISDADDFIIVVMMVISKMIMVWVMVTILNIVMEITSRSLICRCS